MCDAVVFWNQLLIALRDDFFRTQIGCQFDKFVGLQSTSMGCSLDQQIVFWMDVEYCLSVCGEAWVYDHGLGCQFEEIDLNVPPALLTQRLLT